MTDIKARIDRLGRRHGGDVEPIVIAHVDAAGNECGRVVIRNPGSSFCPDGRRWITGQPLQSVIMSLERRVNRLKQAADEQQPERPFYFMYPSADGAYYGWQQYTAVNLS